MIQVDSRGEASPEGKTLRCPRCGTLGVFYSMGQNDLLINNIRLGHRRCPDEECRLHVFIVEEEGQIVKTFPPRRIDFDSSSIPTKIIDVLKEAIECHSHESYVAAAIMVRRTLEELCTANAAAGDNLKTRIADLGSKIILPPELLTGLDDLRLLGNDAAHVESRMYDSIGSREVEVAIRFTKEVLKAIYQYSGLLDELKALRSDPVSE